MHLRAFLRSSGMTQQQVAQGAGVSQATVSRALGSPSLRTGRARQRLFFYIQKQRPQIPAVTVDAIAVTWDGSESHAQALAELILVSAKLRPTVGE